MKNLIKQNINKIPISLYIHIPWCEKKCPYCDFNIKLQKDNDDEINLLEAMLADLNESMKLLGKRKFISVYFGGGTPSLVSIYFIEKIIEKLNQHKIIEKNCEISLEANPNEINKKYVEELINIGVNRISIGIQSFSDSTLRSLGRNHDSKVSFKAMESISQFNNIKSSIDLMYGVMNQDIDSFQKDINTLKLFDLDHLSMYQLTIEPNTIFYKQQIKLPNDDEIYEMESLAQDFLKKLGIYQYEISSWSKKGFESTHNLNYWRYGDFIGVGPGAHSKISSKKEINRGIKLKKLNSYIKNPRKTTINKIDSSNYNLDLAMNLFRIKDGFSYSQLKDSHFEILDSFKKDYKKGVALGLLDIGKLKTTKKGFKFLNDVINLFDSSEKI